MTTKVNAGAFKKGEKRPGQGRPKGATNKVTAELKDMILQALDDAGGVAYLKQRAADPRTAGAFLTLVGKVLPLQVTGEGDGPLVVQVVRLGDADSSATS